MNPNWDFLPGELTHHTLAAHIPELNVTTKDYASSSVTQRLEDDVWNIFNSVKKQQRKSSLG